MSKISVIVPVYNTESYLRECIESILRQSYADFELLLVDDGSTDESAAICDEYEAKDSRVRAFHKPNGGVSSARNLGLDNANGEWVAFVDSDDNVAETYLAELADCVSDDVDLVVSGVYLINDKLAYFPPTRKLAIETDLAFLDEQLCSTYLRTPWAKMFRCGIIQAESIRFNTKMRISEDTEFILNYLPYVHGIQFVSAHSYYYKDSWMGSLRRYAMGWDSIDEHLSILLARLETLKSRFHYAFSAFSTDLKVYFKYMFFIWLYDRTDRYSDFRKELLPFRHRKGVYFAKSKKKEICGTFMLRYCPLVAYLVFRLYKNQNEKRFRTLLQ